MCSPLSTWLTIARYSITWLTQFSPKFWADIKKLFIIYFEKVKSTLHRIVSISEYFCASLNQGLWEWGVRRGLGIKDGRDTKCLSRPIFFLKNWADYFLVRYKHKIKRSLNSTSCFFSRVPSFAHIPNTLKWSWGQLRSITWLQILSYRTEEGRLFAVNLREDITLL